VFNQWLDRHFPTKAPAGRSDRPVQSVPVTGHTSGYISTLGSNLLSWCSKKQQTVSTSSTESEYRAIFKGIQESIWLKYPFQSLNIKQSKKFEIYVNNHSVAAIALATNPIFQQHSKHIDIIYHWPREV
jgi:hypothetical protein